MKKVLAIILIISAFASMTYIVSQSIGNYQGNITKNKHAKGEELYNQRCATCHLENGEGVQDLYPPLQSSDFLRNDKSRIINVLLQGLSGPVTVNGIPYNSVMHPVPGTDRDLSEVLNYVYARFGNGEYTFTPEEIAVLRELHSNHSSN
ncbi:MAG: Copper-containing nitrite reductase precursor [Bacteroidota bacterium]|jgi:nitrite reductase (NO-forming)